MQGKGVPIGTSNKLSNQQKIYQSQISNNQQNALYQPQTPIKTNNQSQQTQTLTGIYSLKDFNGEQGHNSNNNHIPKTGGQQLGGTISASSEEKTIRAAHLKLGQSN